MKKHNIFSSGTIDNLALIKEIPHNEWHAFAKTIDLEPKVFLSKLGRWKRESAVFYQLMEDASEAILKGEANVDELFTLVEVYGRGQKAINEELFTRYGAKRFSDIKGLKEFVRNSKVSEGRIEGAATKLLKKEK